MLENLVRLAFLLKDSLELCASLGSGALAGLAATAGSSLFATFTLSGVIGTALMNPVTATLTSTISTSANSPRSGTRTSWRLLIAT